MIKRTHTKRAPHILPFEEWVAEKYPHNTASRTLLKLIGALDLAYLLYRLQAKPEEKVAKVEKVTKGAEVEKVVKVEKVLKVVKEEKVLKVKKVKKVTKVAKVKKEPEPEVTVEFHEDIEPVQTREPEPVEQPEPEPLVIESEPEPVPTSTKNLTWIDDASLEEQDILRTKTSLGIDGITVEFDTRDIDDERETRLRVNGISYVIMLPSPALNLSQMLQIARVTYGELYVLGRMALGAISGEGYITTDEATRAVHTLHEAGKKEVQMDIQYYAKDKTARSRTPLTQRIIFKPV